ncbi:hypothetical protein chiPu_0015105 [Chiloscyllium punctatum]|uniref:Uncharacterized protein n=1 Tax=Chiloscyllium punctatum TaxID=137246 RepID=A0A401T1U9_CHIPU|nr:hypothetical protein [Chiloscyllium punctatum]
MRRVAGDVRSFPLKVNKNKKEPEFEFFEPRCPHPHSHSHSFTPHHLTHTPEEQPLSVGRSGRRRVKPAGRPATERKSGIGVEVALRERWEGQSQSRRRLTGLGGDR